MPVRDACVGTGASRVPHEAKIRSVKGPRNRL
jgi:hypothetical protein